MYLKRLIICCLFLTGCTTPKKTLKKDPDQTLSKTRFLQIILQEFIAVACQKNPTFRKCTHLSDAECTLFVQKPVSTCIEKISDELPDPVNLTQARLFGNSVGHCTKIAVTSAAITDLPPNKIDSECFNSALRVTVP